MNLFRPTLLLGALVPACSPGAPAEPTWFDDLQPIIRANCSRCHGADPVQANIAAFRLDRYVAGDESSVFYDAHDFAQRIAEVAAEHDTPAMPPDYSLSDRQREILRRWAANGAPKGTRDNQPPGAKLLAPADEDATVDQSVDLALRSWDDDGDALWLEVWAHDRADPDARNDKLLAARVGGGLRSLAVDTGTLASTHDFELYAIVDDGFSDRPEENRTRIRLLQALRVDHGARGTAPTVALLQPNGGGTILGPTTIAWSASDPDDGDVLTIDLDLVEVAPDGAEEVVASIARGLPSDPPQTYEWDPSGLPPESGGDPILYKVRVTATDAGARNTRSDQSDAPFTIAEGGGTTDYVWADVRPIFDTYCTGCHGQPARQPSLEYFRLDKYDADDPAAPANNDLGVYEMRARVYEKLVQVGTMPPAAEPQPSSADVDKIADWIRGGAPGGGVGGDPVPIFTWIVPGGWVEPAPVTLEWTATDDVGLTEGSIYYDAVSGPPSCSGIMCGTQATPSWTQLHSETLAEAPEWSATFVWDSKPTGPEACYCVRGEVTDTAGQTTSVTAPAPVKF